MAFCPHCGSAVIQPFMTKEDKMQEALEIQAAIRSLDEIKHISAKPVAADAIIEKTAPVRVAPAQRLSESRSREGGIGQIIIGVLGVLCLATLLFVKLPDLIKPRPSWTPTIAEKDPDEQTSPIGDIPPIEELSAQDAPEEEDALIAYNAYDDSDNGRTKRGENGFIIEDSDTRAYTAEEIQEMHLTEWDLEIARNEIYARHGRGFNDSTLQAYFDAQEWYEQKYTPEEFDAQSGLLTQTELENIAVIGQVEDSLSPSAAAPEEPEESEG